jgi:hypothetical protein
VHPFDLGGAYPNFMMDDEGDARLKASYGVNYARLAAVKSKYDSANLFRVTGTSSRRPDGSGELWCAASGAVLPAWLNVPPPARRGGAKLIAFSL